ncbi:hypothetical protein PG993_000907 [Apiospora rasikravindrae]|uniref:Uncharacterized protein n=1 Tax=Apiospora rasikravindrae TaxID=990691 RepID=A0ABR1U9X8_9PEZI
METKPMNRKSNTRGPGGIDRHQDETRQMAIAHPRTARISDCTSPVRVDATSTNVAGSAKPPEQQLLLAPAGSCWLLLPSPWHGRSLLHGRSACNALLEYSVCARQHTQAHHSTAPSPWAGRRKYRYIVFSSLKHFGYLGRRLLRSLVPKVSPSSPAPSLFPLFTSQTRGSPPGSRYRSAADHVPDLSEGKLSGE